MLAWINDNAHYIVHDTDRQRSFVKKYNVMKDGKLYEILANNTWQV